MTSPQNLTTTSKFLSLVLRHKPQAIGLTLDASGWVEIDVLLAKAAAAGRPFTRQMLEEVVETSDKKRFAVSEDGLRIRANQGHSVEVELGLAPVSPPKVLYHGTAERFLDSILAEGLTKRKRHHVHLSENIQTALAVGIRYGAPVLLAIDAERMSKEGSLFFRSENNVWLTDEVPSAYLKVVKNGGAA